VDRDHKAAPGEDTMAAEDLPVIARFAARRRATWRLMAVSSVIFQALPMIET